MKCFCRPSGPCSNRSALFQRMYVLRDDPEARRAYLDTIPRELIERLSLFVPEVTLKWPSTMPEVDYLFAKDADVSFKKHNCYTPEFSHSHTYFEVVYVYAGTCSALAGMVAGTVKG